MVGGIFCVRFWIHDKPKKISRRTQMGLRYDFSSPGRYRIQKHQTHLRCSRGCLGAVFEKKEMWLMWLTQGQPMFN